MASALNDPAVSKPVLWKFEVHRRWVPRDDELQRMEAEVQGHPQHPDRSVLATYRRRKAGEDQVQHFSLFWKDAGGWRFCVDDSFDPTYFFDRAMEGKSAWSLSGPQLNVFKTDRPFPASMDLPSTLGEIRTQVRLLTFGGLHVATAMGLRPVQIEGGESPTIEASLAGVATLRFKLSRAADGWDIREMDFVDVPAARAETGRRYVFGRWADSFPLGTRIAMGYKEYAPDGSLENEVTSGEVRVLSAEEFAEATRTPERDRSDPVRGRLTFQSVYDYTSETPVVRSIAGSQVPKATGETTESGASGGSKHEWVSIPLERTPEFLRERGLRRMGWISAGCVTGLVVGLMIRRRWHSVRG